MPSNNTRLKVLFAGVCSLVLLMAIARFSYTSLLPVMLEQTSLDHAWGGWLATLNYIGYMAGALIAASISNLRLKDTLYRWGLILAILTTAGMGLADNIWLWAVLRIVSGLTSAAGLLLASGLILNWLLRHGFRGELGIHFSGIGIGIALLSVVAEIYLLPLAWQDQWYWLGAAGLILIIPAWLWMPRPPKVMPLDHQKKLRDNPPGKQFIQILTVAYFCAGIGYVVSATFIVSIINDLPGLEGQGAWAFALIGLGAAPACILWDYISRSIGHVGAMLIAYLIQVPSIILPALIVTVPSALISAFLFGFSFLGIVCIVLTMGGLYYPSKPAKMMGKMTLSYGLAQIIGPAIIGYFATRFGSYDFGLYMASGAMIFGSILIIWLKLIEKKKLQPALA
ncbi:YbfB/YjiJ family MFS transporter [Curvivirga sp.]|uniref:YbfB/YjiJ family MFS transporter n=1 Tax=Curvivirga sp. TaxID=2856848 RepID=UPI003B5B55EC